MINLLDAKAKKIIEHTKNVDMQLFRHNMGTFFRLCTLGTTAEINLVLDLGNMAY